MSVRDREDAVVSRLHALAPDLDGEPAPDFRATTRARLVAMAAVRTPDAEPASPLRRLLSGADTAPSRWRTRLTAGLAGAALTVTALATVVAVSSGAGPGDALYGVKRGTEQTQLALAGDARGETLLDLASTRLDEVRALVAEEANALPAAGAATGPAQVTLLAAGADPELVLSTLATMDEQTTEGAAWLTQRAVTTDNDDPLSRLSDWTGEQSAELAALGPDAPAAAQDAVAGSLALLSDIGTRIDGLEAALDCAAGPATAGSDELGPMPAPCPPEPPASGAPEGNVPGGGGGTGTPSEGGIITVPEGPIPSTPAPSAPVPGLPGTDQPGGGLLSPPALPELPPVTGNEVLPPLPLPLPLPLPGTGPTPSVDPGLCLPPLPTTGGC